MALRPIPKPNTEAITAVTNPAESSITTPPAEQPVVVEIVEKKPSLRPVPAIPNQEEEASYENETVYQELGETQDN